MFLHKLDVERSERGDGSKTLLAKQICHSVVHSFKTKHANLNAKKKRLIAVPYKINIPYFIRNLSYKNSTAAILTITKAMYKSSL